MTCLNSQDKIYGYADVLKIAGDNPLTLSIDVGNGTKTTEMIPRKPDVN